MKRNYHRAWVSGLQEEVYSANMDLKYGFKGSRLSHTGLDAEEKEPTRSENQRGRREVADENPHKRSRFLLFNCPQSIRYRLHRLSRDTLISYIINYYNQRHETST